MRVLELDGRRFDLARGIDCARPVVFDGVTTRAFGLPAAARRAVLSAAEGDSVNCEVLELCAHGAGTHTESAWHLGGEGPAPYALHDGPVLCQVIRSGAHQVIEAAELEGIEPGVEALVVARGVRAADYSGTNPPHLSAAAAALIRASGVRHLLTDLPSVDREDDAGCPAHRAFFGDDDDGGTRTITELGDFDEVEPGLYALILHLPALVTDAVPSRPVLFPEVRAAT